MDRARAVKVVQHLKEAGLGLESAIRTIADLVQKEQLKQQIGKLFIGLRFEILPQVSISTLICDRVETTLAEGGDGCKPSVQSLRRIGSADFSRRPL
jgi:hypothetical protein